MDMMRNVERLLKTPFPLSNTNKWIFERNDNYKLFNQYIYTCNICKIKEIGETNILAHNNNAKHHVQLQTEIHKLLALAENDKE